MMNFVYFLSCKDSLNCCLAAVVLQQNREAIGPVDRIAIQGVDKKSPIHDSF